MFVVCCLLPVVLCCLDVTSQLIKIRMPIHFLQKLRTSDTKIRNYQWKLELLSLSRKRKNQKTEGEEQCVLCCYRARDRARAIVLPSVFNFLAVGGNGSGLQQARISAAFQGKPGWGQEESCEGWGSGEWKMGHRSRLCCVPHFCISRPLAFPRSRPPGQQS